MDILLNGFHALHYNPETVFLIQFELLIILSQTLREHSIPPIFFLDVSIIKRIGYEGLNHE